MKRHFLKVLVISTVFPLMSVTAGAEEMAVPPFDKVYKSPSLGRWCATGYADFLRGAGDETGNPLELKFLGDPAPAGASREYINWHNNLNAALNARFRALKPVQANGKLVVVGCRYKVSENRQIEDLLLFGDGAQLFEPFLRKAILSLNGSELLILPTAEAKGSRGSGRFVQNYGRELIGSSEEVRDPETIWKESLCQEIERRFDSKGRGFFGTGRRFTCRLSFLVHNDRTITDIEIAPIERKNFHKMGEILLNDILHKLEGTDFVSPPPPVSPPVGPLKIEFVIDKSYKLISCV